MLLVLKVITKGCTLLARWDEGYKDPWLIVTDLKPEQSNIGWYSFRSWIESGYRDIKSDGWQWHKTRLREPARAERIWLAMAVATLWTVTVGSNQQQHLSEPSQDKPFPNETDSQKSAFKRVHRTISCFLKGLLTIIADLLSDKGISLNSLALQEHMAFNTS